MFWLQHSQYYPLKLQNSLTCKSESGSNQPDMLTIEFPVMSLGESTPPPSTCTPTEQKKGKRKEKPQAEKKKKMIPVPPDSPAMATRSKTPLNQSPAAHTRSKWKLPDLNL
jgi:hypothetical protein